MNPFPGHDERGAYRVDYRRGNNAWIPVASHYYGTSRKLTLDAANRQWAAQEYVFRVVAERVDPVRVVSV